MGRGESTTSDVADLRVCRLIVKRVRVRWRPKTRAPPAVFKMC